MSNVCDITQLPPTPPHHTGDHIRRVDDDTSCDYASLLNVRCQHLWKQPPRFVESTSDGNGRGMPFRCAVALPDMTVCTGFGLSKKAARSEAAKRALAILDKAAMHVMVDAKVRGAYVYLTVCKVDEEAQRHELCAEVTVPRNEKRQVTIDGTLFHFHPMADACMVVGINADGEQIFNQIIMARE